jgi:predicted nucleotidyltransferase
VRTKRLGESALLLLDAIAVLLSEGIDYAVIGAMAASVHGVVRASLDADAIMSVATQKLRGLEQRFAAAAFHTELRYGDLDDPIAAMLVLTDQHQNRVDLIVGLRGLELAAFERAVEVPFQGQTLKVIGREDFIAMKVFAGGPQDFADARYVVQAASGQLDLVLLRRLASQYGRQAAVALEALLSTTS